MMNQALLAIVALLISISDLSAAANTTNTGRVHSEDAELFGRCSRRGCFFLQQQMHKKNPDGTCQNRCAFFGFPLKRQGWECGTCGDLTEVQISPNEFNARLDLSSVSEQFQEAFTKAAAKWQTVIKGDIADYPTANNIQGLSNCVLVPKVVDDTYICAVVANIDGRGGVLGRAGSEFVREDGGLPITGRMYFDAEDVESLISRGKFESVILHEMGHILGISGSSWRRHKMSSSCKYKADSKASKEWQAITGCPSNVPIPVEQDGGGGTACSHWDEYCLRGEMMSGYLSGGMELSRMSVGALEDIGYEVDYSAADEFGVDKMNPTCVKDMCGTRRRLGQPSWVDAFSEVKEEKLDKGEELARAYGEATLQEMALQRPDTSSKSSMRGSFSTGSLRRPSAGNGALYVADEFVSVVYEDDQGEVRSLSITK